jgi:hypothetical protein
VLLPVEADLIALALTAVALIGTLVYMVRGGRLFSVIIGGGIMTLAFAVLSVLTIKYSARVIRVTRDGEPHAEKQMLVLSKTLTVNGKDVELSSSDVRTIVVNETSRPLTIRAAVYSELSAGPRPPGDVTIEPFGVLHFAEHIDHVGPTDPLPREVSSSSSSTTKYWLTW